MKQLLAISLCFVALNAGAQVKKNINLNPIIPDNIADPSLVMFRDTFYMYATTDVDHGLAKGGPPVVWKSVDFKNWHFEGVLDMGMDWSKGYSFTNEKGEQRTGYFRYWAPGKPITRNGKFYLFPTIVTPDDKVGTYVVEADNPAGPFRFINGDRVHFPAKETDAKPIVNDIDGEPFVDEDGRTYIFWRQRQAVEVSDDLQRQVTNVITVPTLHGAYSEGPGMFKRKGIYYYFYTQSGDASYANGYMMSRKTPLEGFEVPSGKNIFIRSDTATGVWGPGHGNVFQLPGKDEFFFIYLEYGEGGTTRQVFANRMAFNVDGTIQPVKPDFKGVDLFPAKKKTVANPFSGAVVTASSVRKDRIVKGTIAPDPDLARATKGLPTLKVERTATYLPAHTVDGSNGTRWRAETSDAAPWIQYDLGKVKRLGTLELFFVFPAYGHAWYMEKSNDGKTWTRCAAQETVAVRSPHLAKNIGKARFIRIHITKGEPGIWEIKHRP